MSLFAIGDLHLSLTADKSMAIFSGWENYVERIRENWENTVSTEDTVVLIGDSSWGMSFAEAYEDFKFIHNLPGQKIILKGNHDYWWNTKSKMDKFFSESGFDSLHILHNNHYQYGEYGICGTRGWINENTEPADAKVLAREAGRLDMSIQSAKKAGLIPLVFLHYPPLYAGNYNYDMLDVLYRHGIKQCFYGHIHGKGCSYAINGERDGIDYLLLSGDFIQFKPYKIL